MTDIEVSILNMYPNFRFLKKSLIKKIFKEIVSFEEIKSKIPFGDKVSFDVVFCDDAKIQEINKDYRGIDKPTDVITFALFMDTDDAMDNENSLGEIIISVDTAKKQAKNGLETEICYLICHGILHLLGFDHQTKKDYNFIVNIQNQVTERLIKNGKISL